MRSTFIPDVESETGEIIPGVDRHYYERQVATGSAFDEDGNAFKRATAHAKDKARHELIKAVRQQQADAQFNAGRFEELASFARGERIGVSRTIDGIEGAPDNDIKL